MRNIPYETTNVGSGFEGVVFIIAAYPGTVTLRPYGHYFQGTIIHPERERSVSGNGIKKRLATNTGKFGFGIS